MGIEVFATDWAIDSRYLIVAAILFVIAMIVLAASVLSKYLRRWRENRRLYSIVQTKVRPCVLPDTTPQAERLVNVEAARYDALGWPADDNLAGLQEQPGVEPGAVLGREKTILIADDDPVVVEALSCRLRHLGFQVLRSPDAAYALMGAMKMHPDLVILDVEMPEGNGLAVCEMMACDRGCADIPVIIHSVFADKDVKQRCRRLGAYHVEKSPRSWAEIKSLVETLIGEHETAKPQPTTEKLSTDSGQVSLSAASPESFTVLCIDDDPLVARSIAVRLQPYRIKVKGADNGTQGYLLAVTAHPDLILLDLKIPNGDGSYVLGRLKDNPQTKDIPVIILTMDTTAGVRRRMLSLGADAFLNKPVDWREMFAEMGRCIKLPKQLLIDYNLPERLTLAQL